MSDQTCDCCESRSRTSNSNETMASDRWLTERPITEAALPSEVTTRMGRVLHTKSIETLDAFAARDAAGGRIAVEDLCHASTPTPHRAVVDGETHYFRCFFDAVVLALLVDEPVEIRTESPAGESIEMRATPDRIDSTAGVMSFGVSTEVCPYVRAFPTRAAYEQWADRVDAATVGFPLAASVPLAEAFAE